MGVRGLRRIVGGFRHSARGMHLGMQPYTSWQTAEEANIGIIWMTVMLVHRVRFQISNVGQAS
jgi:hypothetical protein